MTENLNIAFLHMDIIHGQPETNRSNLLDLAEAAIKQGSRIIVSPEMAISGYSFDSPDEILPYAETMSGPTAVALAMLSRQYQCYICVGLAEYDEKTGKLHNTALLLGPDGNIACKYRKINAEKKWATSGDVRQKGCVDTPWGRIGILICSDTYYGILPRVMALKGVDLLLVLANWPPSSLDPREIWRARALENAFYIVACNRTGLDRRMDCTEASSCIASPNGTMFMDGKTQSSCFFLSSIPLDQGRGSRGTRKSGCAESGLQSRIKFFPNLQHFRHSITLSDLPATGRLHLYCVASGNGPLLSKASVMDLMFREKREKPGVLVLPDISPAAWELMELAVFAEQTRLVICASNKHTGLYVALPGKEPRCVACRNNHEFPCVLEYGPARIGFVTVRHLHYPELITALAQTGCDLLVTATDALDDNEQLLVNIRCVERMAVAVATRRRAGVCFPPRGHERWKETYVNGPGVCSCALDTADTRDKGFLYRLNVESLMEELAEQTEEKQETNKY